MSAEREPFATDHDGRPPGAADGGVPACFVCRCEEIEEGAIVAAIASGARSVNDVKRQTRAGMGVCQGIYCATTIVGLLARDAETAPLDPEPMTARPPTRPVRLDRLAALANASAADADGG